jgi:hypothetical protein
VRGSRAGWDGPLAMMDGCKFIGRGNFGLEDREAIKVLTSILLEDVSLMDWAADSSRVLILKDVELKNSERIDRECFTLNSELK